MKKSFTWLLVVAFVLGMTLFWSQLAYAWTVNQHYQNKTGQTAYDLTKILMGNYVLTDTMLHLPFDSCTIIPLGPFAIVRWHGGQVAPNGWGHACFTTAQNIKPLVVIPLWTDANGLIIGTAGPAVGAFIDVIKETNRVRVRLNHYWRHWTGTGFPPELTDSAGAFYGRIIGTEVHYAVIDEELPLEELNDSLWGPYSSIVWNPLDTFYVDSLEEKSYDLGIGDNGDVYLFRFNARGDGLDMYEVIQHKIVRPPTLTQWGLIVFAGLFILTLIYVLKKRKGAILRSSA